MTTREDARALEWVRARVHEFVEHVRREHAADASTAALLSKFRGVRALVGETASPSSGTWRNGKFKHSTGELFVALRDNEGAARTPSSLAKTIVHELAHATRNKAPGETSHSQEWKQTWLRFLSIATQELGWTVDIKCAECTFYGLCDAAQCPKCNWLQNLCRPYVGPPGE